MKNKQLTFQLQRNHSNAARYGGAALVGGAIGAGAGGAMVYEHFTNETTNYSSDNVTNAYVGGDTYEFNEGTGGDTYEPNEDSGSPYPNGRNEGQPTEE